jgi:hypothetical protein
MKILTDNSDLLMRIVLGFGFLIAIVLLIDLQFIDKRVEKKYKKELEKQIKMQPRHIKAIKPKR